MDTTPQLNRGTALVIIGPQGCGKTNLAKTIARDKGCFEEVTLRELVSEFRLAHIMADKPASLIVDIDVTFKGLCHASHGQRIHDLLNKETILIERKMRQPVLVKTPLLIFCADDLTHVKALSLPRYSVIDLTPHHTAASNAPKH